MQRLKFSKWRVFNPVGDVLRTKLVWRTTWSFIISDTMQSSAFLPDLQYNPFMFNNIRNIVTDNNWAGPAHHRSSASFQAAVFFRRYRCDGVAISMWPKLVSAVNPSGVYDAGTYEFLQNSQWSFNVRAGGTSEYATGLSRNMYMPYTVAESRWGRSWPVTNPNTNYTKRRRIYFSTKKVFGPLLYSKTDLDFTGVTDFSDDSGFAAAGIPVIGPALRFSVTRSDSATNNIPSTWGVRFEIPMTFVFYVTYFDKYPNATTL